MLSLAFLGHAAWSIIEIAAFASAASAILIGVIVILRRHWLNLLVPAVLLVLHVILGVTIAFAHDSLNWGSPFAPHQQIRRFAWIGLLPLIADCLLFASLGPLKRRTGAGARRFLALVAHCLPGARSGQMRVRCALDLSIVAGALLIAGLNEDLSTGIPRTDPKLACILILVGILLLAAITVLIFLHETASFWREPGGLTMKIAFERFPGAIAIGSASGAPLLLNDEMNRVLAARGLNAHTPIDQIWRELAENSTKDGLAIRILRSGSPGIRGQEEKGSSDTGPILLRHGCRAWLMRRMSMEHGIIHLREQIWGQDVTEHVDLIERLEKENTALAESMQHLQASLRRINALMEKQDILGARLRIHDVLAQRLTFVRCFLEDGVSEPSRTRALSDMLVTLDEDLRADSADVSAQRLQAIASGCALMGCELVIRGSLPGAPQVAEVMIAVLSQATTNAVLHADAQRIDALFDEGPFTWSLRIRNPLAEKVDVVERTGLSGMRSRVEALGGSMRVSADSHFLIRVLIPKDARLQGESSE
ncbi:MULTISPECIES: hypothetical protein [Schaalia]|uniref:hypothetical protein n=1 Tax=Schaalia TaxID=2529408 RepID=UPI0026EA7D83|nr:hypothetical protein [Schaalia hyovaginalis]MCI6556742.1 hypothetical protein [Schaalia hyovaginalis]MDD7554292.1 hypothetical protein [Schaalia hyovaginalis]MDY3093340.1 hypothetical protein [Schaalia hyovaginalis]MDY4492075.1 hypothetical protein [Schaalia hyovaginalis]